MVKILIEGIKVENLGHLEVEHIEIIEACVCSEIFDEGSKKQWIDIFDGLKEYLFVGLCDLELCEKSIKIIKSFYKNDFFNSSILNISKNTLIAVLSLLYSPERDE